MLDLYRELQPSGEYGIDAFLEIIYNYSIASPEDYYGLVKHLNEESEKLRYEAITLRKAVLAFESRFSALSPSKKTIVHYNTLQKMYESIRDYISIERQIKNDVDAVLERIIDDPKKRESIILYSKAYANYTGAYVCCEIRGLQLMNIEMFMAKQMRS